ncbi:MAG: hypothetical protein IKR25_09495 [Muribaculaceae bacterium]|nr:hypothetical protein [Muribaculaceae bacterium]
MKKILLPLLAVLMPASLAIAAEGDAWPWNFPQAVPLEASPGQWALSCYTFYPSAVKEGKDLTESTLIFYSGKLGEVGESVTPVNGTEMPNALIIPLDPNARAKKGDIVLTWWQEGSGLQRAIVTDASNPAEPKVDYLDMNYGDEKNPGFAQREADQQLKPGSFIVLRDGEWAPGAQVAARDGGEWLATTLVCEHDGKLLVLGWSDHLKVYDKKDCRLVPFNEKLKKGDKVMATFVDGYRSGYTVKKVDAKIGRVWVERDGSTDVKSIAEVTKVLGE